MAWIILIAAATFAFAATGPSAEAQLGFILIGGLAIGLLSMLFVKPRKKREETVNFQGRSYVFPDVPVYPKYTETKRPVVPTVSSGNVGRSPAVSTTRPATTTSRTSSTTTRRSDTDDFTPSYLAGVAAGSYEAPSSSSCSSRSSSYSSSDSSYSSWSSSDSGSSSSSSSDSGGSCGGGD